MEQSGAYPAYLHFTTNKYSPPTTQRITHVGSPLHPGPAACCHIMTVRMADKQKATRGCAPQWGFGAPTVPFLSVSVACTNKMSPDPPRTSGPSSPCNEDRNMLGMAQAPFSLLYQRFKLSSDWQSTQCSWHCLQHKPQHGLQRWPNPGI